MQESVLQELLAAVARGETTVAEAVQRLRDLPYEDLGFAKLDHHRALRQGFPEVVLGTGKSAVQLAGILERLLAREGPVLATRVPESMLAELAARFPALTVAASCRALYREPQPWADRGVRAIAVVSAGSADEPVAEEAALTAHLMGNRVERHYDVGVAGLHRLLAVRSSLDEAGVVVVVAGMEGALPSVVAGLVAVPVVAVPTSVGYGAALGGLAALFSMLSSCAAGVTVVNIDNGFGAGFAAALVNRRRGG